MFSDDDMQRLKAYHQGRDYYIPTSGPHVLLWDIITRLETAEALLPAWQQQNGDPNTRKVWEEAKRAWMKASGRRA